MKNILFVAALLICGTVFSQKKYKDLKSQYNAQVECLGTGADQVQVLKVFSFKKKRKVKQEDYAKIKRGAILLSYLMVYLVLNQRDVLISRLY